MRDRTKLFSFALCALLMLGFASTVQAQVQYTVSSNPNEVVQYGNTELMGEFRFTVAAVPVNVIGSTITITYQGVTITNPIAAGTAACPDVGACANEATGVTVRASAGFGAVTYQAVASTGGGGQVIVSIPANAAPAIAVGDVITVNGVRADVSARSVGSDINAALSSSPSNANTFLNASILRVATVNTSLTIGVTGVTRAICTTGTDPTIVVTEGFAGVFVQYVNSALGTAFPVDRRILYGANSNTQVNIVVTGLPAGATLSWPATVVAAAGTGTLERLTGVNLATGATYEYTTGAAGQGPADNLQEVFNITPVVAVAITASVGSSTAQGQLYPATGTTAVPRFNHPLIPSPAPGFVNVTKCVTNLLFPFVANVAGYDTGFAIANTSYDVQAITPTTATQSGPVTFYLYKAFTEPGPAPAPATFTVANVSAGNTWAGTMSNAPALAGSQGYIIAVAQFQYAHGFGFISYGNASGLVLAEGYIASVIPDVALTTNVRQASPSATANSGESLGN
jgi:hypothetical protein